jgi:SAM-dependent methyltransferase
LVPLSRNWAAERGRPIDRYYIERFLAEHRRDIRGAVLEVGGSGYTRRFGGWPHGGAVSSSDVLTPDGWLEETTVVADLAHAPQLEDDRWDCIICTQVLGFVYDVEAAIATLARVLRPNGTVLATLPAGIPLCRQDLWEEFWRFTAASARDCFEQSFPATGVAVKPCGNLLAAAAFLQGLAEQDLRAQELERHEAEFPLVITVRARLPATSVRSA